MYDIVCDRAPVTNQPKPLPPRMVDLDESEEEEDMEAEDAEPEAEVEAEAEAEEEDLGGFGAPGDEKMEECEEQDDESQSEDDDEDSDPDSDSSSIDEELSIHLKPPEERANIRQEIDDLHAAMPRLSNDYKIVDRLGTGTFSSVYKAIDLHYHEKWHNKPWHARHPVESSAHYQSVAYPEDAKVFVAIKRIYVTSNPERIRNEISILEDCRGTRHVSQIITAFRHEDQVVAVMPYHRNADFRVRQAVRICSCHDF